MKEMELAQRAQAGDVQAQWDLILQRARDSAASAEPDATGLVALKLRPVQSHILPAVHRRFDRVDHDLLDLLRQLATGNARWPLYLHGHAGTGKTMAALCLCDVAETAAYFTVENLCNEVMQGAVDWEVIRSKDLAVLDEIGEREKVTDLHYTTIKTFLDARFLHAQNVAVYISNVEPASLPGLYDDRIASRLLSGSVFELVGPDRRRQG